MYRCCIFDLDGTLVDSIHALNYTINLTLERFGLGPVTEEQTKRFVGDGSRKLVERALKSCGDEEPSHQDEAMEVYNRLFRIHCLHRVAAYDGISELLQYLKSQGILTAVLSNKPHDRTMDNVSGVFGPDVFDLVMGEKEKEGIRRKPDPAGALLVADALGVGPADCLYLGDTNTDMRTGIAAGMDTVGVTWGFRCREELEEFHPRYIVDRPQEVIEIMKRDSGGLR